MMKAALISSTLAAVALISAAPAFAQRPFHFGQPALSPPYAYRHASTATEGYLRGTADLMRAAGENRLNRAEAARREQDAINRGLENAVKATATYFEMKQINREARAEMRGQRPTKEDLARIARDKAPDRLASYYFDAAHNRLNWPDIFNHPYFAPERNAIDRLMSARGGAGPEARQIQNITNAMIDKLVSVVREVKPNQYIEAKRFLQSLEYEMNFASRPAGIAAR